MNALNEIVEKYYLAHQISKSINILDLAKRDKPDSNIKPLKCICGFLEPSEGWDKNVSRTSSDGEKCYHCSKQLSEKFSDYVTLKKGISLPGPDNEQCKYCYWFCARKYISESDTVRLNKKFIKASKIK